MGPRAAALALCAFLCVVEATSNSDSLGTATVLAAPTGFSDVLLETEHRAWFDDDQELEELEELEDLAEVNGMGRDDDDFSLAETEAKSSAPFVMKLGGAKCPKGYVDVKWGAHVPRLGGKRANLKHGVGGGKAWLCVKKSVMHTQPDGHDNLFLVHGKVDKKDYHAISVRNYCNQDSSLGFRIIGDNIQRDTGYATFLCARGLVAHSIRMACKRGHGECHYDPGKKVKCPAGQRSIEMNVHKNFNKRPTLLCAPSSLSRKDFDDVYVLKGDQNCCDCGPGYVHLPFVERDSEGAANRANLNKGSNGPTMVMCVPKKLMYTGIVDLGSAEYPNLVASWAETKHGAEAICRKHMDKGFHIISPNFKPSVPKSFLYLCARGPFAWRGVRAQCSGGLCEPSFHCPPFMDKHPMNLNPEGNPPVTLCTYRGNAPRLAHKVNKKLVEELLLPNSLEPVEKELNRRRVWTVEFPEVPFQRIFHLQLRLSFTGDADGRWWECSDHSKCPHKTRTPFIDDMLSHVLGLVATFEAAGLGAPLEWRRLRFACPQVALERERYANLTAAAEVNTTCIFHVALDTTKWFNWANAPGLTGELAAELEARFSLEVNGQNASEFSSLWADLQAMAELMHNVTTRRQMWYRLEPFVQNRELPTYRQLKEMLKYKQIKLDNTTEGTPEWNRLQREMANIKKNMSLYEYDGLKAERSREGLLLKISHEIDVASRMTQKLLKPLEGIVTKLRDMGFDKKKPMPGRLPKGTPGGKMAHIFVNLLRHRLVRQWEKAVPGFWLFMDGKDLFHVLEWLLTHVKPYSLLPQGYRPELVAIDARPWRPSVRLGIVEPQPVPDLKKLEAEAKKKQKEKEKKKRP